MADHSRDISPGEEILYRNALPVGGPWNQEIISGAGGDTATVGFLGAPPPPPPDPEPDSPIIAQLVEPVSDVVMQDLVEGDTIEKPFAIKLVPAMPVGSLRIYIGTAGGPPSTPRVENSAPYAAFGNSGNDFAPAVVPAGLLTLKIEGWSGAGATGTKRTEVTYHFTIAEPDSTPPPPPPPPPGGGAGLPSSVTSVLSAGAVNFLSLTGTGFVEKCYDVFDTNIAQGLWGKPGTATAFPQMTRGGRWRPTNPTYRDSSGRGRYAGQDTCYVQGGELIEFIRSGVKGVTPFVHNASGERMVSRPVPIWGADVTGITMETVSRRKSLRIDLVAKFPGGEAAGYKVAYLLWRGARINNVGYAEEDYPEFRFGSADRINAYHHMADAIGGQVAYIITPVDVVNQFHLFTMIAHAKGYKGHATGYTEFYLDGVLGGRRSTVNVTNGDWSYFKQCETLLKNVPTLPPPSSGKIYNRLFRVSEPT